MGHFSNFFNLLFGGILGSKRFFLSEKDMPEIIKTTKEILQLLNSSAEGEIWEEIPEYFAMNGADISFDNIKLSNRSIALKAFFNKKTGEVKTYIAKFVDAEANKLLP